MRNLIDRRGWREWTGPNELQFGGDRVGETPVEIATSQGNVFLFPHRAPQRAPEKVGNVSSSDDRLRPVLIGLLLLAGMVLTARARMTVFSAPVGASSRALSEGSLMVLHADPVQTLVHERDRRREALDGYDRHIAGTAGNPTLQAAWRDLEQRENEALERLERDLGRLR